MNLYLLTDNQIQKGYDYLNKNNYAKCCDVWLDAWGGITSLMVEEGLENIRDLDKNYEWTQFISNYVQDLDEELRSAGTIDKDYLHKRIEYCQELYEYIAPEDQLMRENTLRSIPETYYLLDDYECGEQEFEKMLADDPTAGWVYIGYAQCCAYEQEFQNYDKAMEIMLRGLRVPDLRDRIDVLDCAGDIARGYGDNEKTEIYMQEVRKLSSVRVTKVGRNEPCPCGSGKKYKKCCWN